MSRLSRPIWFVGLLFATVAVGAEVPELATGNQSPLDVFPNYDGPVLTEFDKITLTDRSVRVYVTS